MKRLLAVSVVLVLALTGAAHAVPELQLDIAGGYYGGTQVIEGSEAPEDTIFSSGATFDLYALLKGADYLSDTFALSVAVVPQKTQPGGDFGSFTIKNMLDASATQVFVTSDMVYGRPPVETLGGIQTKDANDLPGHGIFNTYFKEYTFLFDSANEMGIYDTAERALAGDPMPTGGTGLYYNMWSIDTTGLTGGIQLHFDLYRMVASGTDVDINLKAPFSHDAESNGHKVPEPGTLALLGMGLVGIGIFRRRK